MSTKRCGLASNITSAGLPKTSCPASAWRVGPGSVIGVTQASEIASCSAWSTAITAGPQPLATMASRLPRGLRGVVRARAAENISPMALTRSTPAPQRGVEGVVAVAAGAAVRLGDGRANESLPGLDGDHRLDAGGGAHGAEKAARIAQPFEVEQDAFGLRVAGEMVEDLRQLDVVRFAGREDRRSRIPRCGSSRECGRTPRTIATPAPDFAGRDRLHDRRRVQPGVRQDIAGGIRAEEADRIAACDRRKLPAGQGVRAKPPESTTAPWMPRFAQASTMPGTVCAGVAMTASDSGASIPASVARGRAGRRSRRISAKRGWIRTAAGLPRVRAEPWPSEPDPRWRRRRRSPRGDRKGCRGCGLATYIEAPVRRVGKPGG